MTNDNGALGWVVFFCAIPVVIELATIVGKLEKILEELRRRG